MISEADISVALQQRLTGILGLPPIAFENKDFTDTRPYVAVEIVPTSRTDRTLSGGHIESRGFMQINIVREIDEWAEPALRLADTIMAHFPKGLRLAVAFGEIVITKPPEIKQGYRDGPNWRLPVHIH